MHRMRGVTIGDNVYIGQYCKLDNAYPEYVYIEDNVSIVSGVSIVAHTNPYPHFKNVVESSVSPVVIKEGAWTGWPLCSLPTLMATGIHVSLITRDGSV